MNKILCLILHEECTIEMQEMLKKQDESGAEVHIYTNLIDQNIQPYDILYMFARFYKKGEDNRYIFISNINNLFSVIYRIYHQIFDLFIYFREEDKGVQLDGIFETILKNKVVTEECLFKPIYVNTTIDLYELNIVQYLNNPKIFGICAEDLIYNNEDITKEYYQKYYYIDQKYYFFEPVLGSKIIINLESNKAKQRFENTVYLYDYNIEKINEIAKLLLTVDNKSYASTLFTIEELLNSYELEFRSYDNFIEKVTSVIIYDLALEVKTTVIGYILLVSFLAQNSKNAYYYVNDLYEFSINCVSLSVEMKYYMWFQLSRTRLENSDASDINSRKLIMKLYKKVFEGYKKQFKNDLVKIPKSKRDSNIIIIMTRLFLTEGNAPTHSVLERCYTLGKLLKKKVMLINTKVYITQVGYCMYYRSAVPNVKDVYNNITHYKYKDFNIPFYQPTVEMPDLNEINNIINTIKKLKPWLIINIGGGNIVADLCGEMVPEATISLAFSTIQPSMGSFSIIGKKLSETEKNEWIKKGYEEDEIIESKFTFDLKPQVKSHTKEEYGIPKDRFVLAVIGLRLSYEIKKDFIEAMCKSFEMGTHLVFVGNFDEYDSWCNLYPDLKKYSTYTGVCNDIMGFVELIDLYINPKRIGGGFSIIEAFHHGKPGITINYGDVAVSGGHDFCVDTYEEMVQLIKRYIEDKEFYMTMSRKAKDREREMTDPKEAMEDIIHKIETSKLFF